jgi:hypothetical protein
MTKAEVVARLKSIDLQVKVGTRLTFFAWIFWILETIIFISIYGMHSGPVNDIENACDISFIIALFIGVGISISANIQMTRLMHKILSDDLKS